MLSRGVVGEVMIFKRQLQNSMLLFAALALTNCSSLTMQRSSTVPAWVTNHPISRSYFIGVGSAKIEDDLHAAQKLARNRALQDIAEQIQVSIVSDVRMSAQCRIINNNTRSDNTYKERIAAFSQAVVCGWEETRTYHAANGYFWSKVILSKKKYHEQVNRKVANAIEKLCDIIRYAQEGTAQFRIQELYKGFEIIDDFFGTPLQARMNGREVLLSNELHRTMSRLLGSIEIKPVVTEISLTAKQSIPQTLGVYVYCNGIVDKSLPVVWSASHNRVLVKTAPMHDDGMRPVFIASLPPSSARVIVTATPDFKKLAYDLIRRKFTLPSGSFTIRRQKAAVYINTANPFCQSLGETLEDRAAITLVTDKNDAEFILTSDLIQHANIVLKNSIYQADADLAIILLATNGTTVLNYNRIIQTCDGISADRALDNTEKYALEVAVKQVERVF